MKTARESRTIPPASRVVTELLATIPTLPFISQDDLWAIEARVARTYTALALHEKRPVDEQGDRGPEAWAYRQQWQDAAEKVWLAVQDEDVARRRAAAARARAATL